MNCVRVSVPKYENKIFDHFTPIKGTSQRAIISITMANPSSHHQCVIEAKSVSGVAVGSGDLLLLLHKSWLNFTS